MILPLLAPLTMSWIVTVSFNLWIYIKSQASTNVLLHPTTTNKHLNNHHLPTVYHKLHLRNYSYSHYYVHTSRHARFANLSLLEYLLFTSQPRVDSVQPLARLYPTYLPTLPTVPRLRTEHTEHTKPTHRSSEPELFVCSTLPDASTYSAHSIIDLAPPCR